MVPSQIGGGWRGMDEVAPRAEIQNGLISRFDCGQTVKQRLARVAVR